MVRLMASLIDSLIKGKQIHKNVAAQSLKMA
jgi:hypothetical protein